MFVGVVTFFFLRSVSTILSVTVLSLTYLLAYILTYLLT